MYSTKGENITAEVEAFKKNAPMSSCEGVEAGESSRLGVKKSNDVRKNTGGSSDVRSIFPIPKPVNSPVIRATPLGGPTPTQPSTGKYVPPHLRKK